MKGTTMSQPEHTICPARVLSSAVALIHLLKEQEPDVEGDIEACVYDLERLIKVLPTNVKVGL